MSQKSSFHPYWLLFSNAPSRRIFTRAMADDSVPHLLHSSMIIASLFFFLPLLNKPPRLFFHHDPNFISSPSERFKKTFESDIFFFYRVTLPHPTLHCLATLFALSKWDASTHAFLTRAEGYACWKFYFCVCVCTAHLCACVCLCMWVLHTC